MLSNGYSAYTKVQILLRRINVWVLFAIALLWFYPLTGWDEAVSRYYFSNEVHGFPLRNDILYSTWLHDRLRLGLYFLPTAVLCLLVKSAWLSGWSIKTKRLLWLLGVQIFAPLVVSFLKSHTSPICPWDMTVYGGGRITPAFSFASSSQAGNCFPAGHPAVGWALLTYYYFFNDTHPKLARFAFLMAFLLGTLMSLVQIARGAHLLSHVLWSLWVVWFVVWCSYRWFWPAEIRR